MKIKPTDKLEVFNGCLKVNGKPFVVDFPDEPLRKINDEGRLVTWFRGCDSMENTWEPEDIEGYWA